MTSSEQMVAFERGDALDHFIVVEQLGAGGMGVVLSAYDPDLHRKVAVKLLATTRIDPSASTRLLREAQAMAKLSHPNVATVYEVGMVDDHVYIAMELVDGVTLGDWLGAEPRTVEQVLEAFAGAGQGLAAAHEAGLVHRDFKPNNVMVGSDSRPRVLDFGLARPAPETGPAPSGLEDTEVDTPLDQTVTRQGAIIGTPAYMAPEQYRGQAVDERSDQFSFCVALYETFYGSRPFSPKVLLDLDKPTVAAALKREATREVPSHVRAVLERGLQPLRRDRFQTMTELLAQLQPRPRSRTRYLGLGGVALVASMAGLTLWSQGAAETEACPVPTALLNGVWDHERQVEVERGFRASGRPYANETFAAVKTTLDQYTSRWVATRREACMATHLRKEQSPHLLDLRMQCLDRRLSVVSNLTKLFANAPSGATVDKAREATAGLPPLDYCNDAAALTAVVAPPDEPAVRAQVVAVRAVIDQARAAQWVGQYKRGLAMIEPLIDIAHTTEYQPVIAEALLMQGGLLNHLGESAKAEPILRSAGLAGAKAKLDLVTVHAWMSVIGILSETGEFKEALALVPLLTAVVARGNLPAVNRARFLDLVGLVHSRNGEYKIARTYHERALALARTSGGTHTHEYSVILNHLGLNRWRNGKLDEALELLQQKLRLDISLFTAKHPSVARALNNIGIVYKRQGKFGKARDYFLRALNVVNNSVGPNHVLAALPHENIGYILSESREYAAARKHHQHALDIRIKTYGRNHLKVAQSLEGLGGVLWYEGKITEAVPYYEEALTIQKAKLRPGHPRIATAVHNLGGLLAMQNKLVEALAYFDQAVTLREKALGPSHQRVAVSLTGMGECLIHLKRYQQAATTLDRALAIQRNAKWDPAALADTTNQLSRALWELGKKPRATQLARETHKLYKAAGKRRLAEFKDVDKWMKKRKLL